MKNLIVRFAVGLMLVACGSQVVEFPVNSDNPTADGPPDLMNLDAGMPDNNQPDPNPGNDGAVDAGVPVVDSATPVVDSGNPVKDTGTVVDAGPSTDAGNVPDAEPANDSAPPPETCDETKCYHHDEDGKCHYHTRDDGDEDESDDNDCDEHHGHHTHHHTECHHYGEVN